MGRSVVRGQDGTAGPGRFIGSVGVAGHVPLSSHYGLVADQVLQATVVTTLGEIMVANDAHNQDLPLAIRDGGPELYGTVVEYTLRTHLIPEKSFSSPLSLW